MADCLMGAPALSSPRRGGVRFPKIAARCSRARGQRGGVGLR
jgi:hypothetical protein